MTGNPIELARAAQRARHEAAAVAIVEAVYCNVMSLGIDVRSGARLTPALVRKLNQTRREIEFIVEENAGK